MIQFIFNSAFDLQLINQSFCRYFQFSDISTLLFILLTHQRFQILVAKMFSEISISIMLRQPWKSSSFITMKIGEMWLIHLNIRSLTSLCLVFHPSFYPFFAKITDKFLKLPRKVNLKKTHDSIGYNLWKLDTLPETNAKSKQVT